MSIALATDPHRLVAVHATRAAAFYFSRDFEHAIQECEKALALDPDHFMLNFILGRAYIRSGAAKKAITHLKRACGPTGEVLLATAALGLAYAVSGKPEQTMKMLQEFTVASRTRYVPPTYLAMMYAGLGQKD